MRPRSKRWQNTACEAIRDAVAETVERLGTLDVAVVNAGVFSRALVEAFALEDLDLMLDVNVRGVFLAIQASVVRMHAGGRVVTIGSDMTAAPPRIT